MVMRYKAFAKNLILLESGFSNRSFWGIFRLLPQVDQLADKAVIALPRRSVAVELVLGALFHAHGGSGLVRFFGIVTHVHSCLLTAQPALRGTPENVLRENG